MTNDMIIYFHFLLVNNLMLDYHNFSNLLLLIRFIYRLDVIKMCVTIELHNYLQHHIEEDKDL